MLVGQKLIPLFPLRACRRLDLHLAALHLIPVRAQRGAAALLVALHHGALGVLVCVAKDLLEERVERAVAADVRILLRRFLLLGCEDGGCQRFPILRLLAYADRGRRLG